jgi:hypothetical protein
MSKFAKRWKLADLSPMEQAAIERDEAARIASLWQKPLLAEREIAEACSLPYSTWAALKKRGGPQMFKLGRRLYAHTAEVKIWLNGLAKSGVEL